MRHAYNQFQVSQDNQILIRSNNSNNPFSKPNFMMPKRQINQIKWHNPTIIQTKEPADEEPQNVVQLSKIFTKWHKSRIWTEKREIALEKAYIKVPEDA